MPVEGVLLGPQNMAPLLLQCDHLNNYLDISLEDPWCAGKICFDSPCYWSPAGSCYSTRLHLAISRNMCNCYIICGDDASGTH